MCGIAGFFTPGGSAGSPQPIAQAMAQRMIHRGPDMRNAWIDEARGITLVHARLAVLDLSEAGNQPMIGASGRWVICFNGEIYNHLEIRRELEQAGHAPSWHGHSDTETILAGVEAWGIGETLTRLRGMFAFGLWDRQREELILARDRLGEKPLYYGWQNGVLLFASEPDFLRAHPAFRDDINRDAISLLVRHAYIASPHSIYAGIHKLEPGHYLTLSADKRDGAPVRYWDAIGVANNGMADPWRGSDKECIDRLETLLKDAVAGQMMSDVPLGAFLSGGVDSSTIVALMQAQSGRPVRTFSIGFEEAEYNEAEAASKVAAHLGTEHTELYLTSAQALEVVDKLATIYSEPFADSSQIPTYMVSRMTRGHVTVALSGDGGDELFAGYNRYLLADRLWRMISRIPRPLRSGLGRMLSAIPPEGYGEWRRTQRLLLGRASQIHLGNKIHKGARALAARNTRELYDLITDQWAAADNIVLGGRDPRTPLDEAEDRLRTDDVVHQMMGYDLVSYLPADILCKVDRAAMAVSLETRVPMLDHRVVSFAWSLPLSMKIRGGVSKWALRQVLYRHVPPSLIDRPKAGFSVPLAAWLRGPLRQWAEDLLSEDRLKREGYLDPAPVRHAWRLHLSGRPDRAHHLWTVLMFQQWLAARR